VSAGAARPGHWQLQKQALTQKRAAPVVDGQPHIGSAAGHAFESVQLRWHVQMPGPGPPHAQVEPVGQSFRSTWQESGPASTPPSSRAPPLPPPLPPPMALPALPLPAAPVVPPTPVPAEPPEPVVPPGLLPAAPGVPPSETDSVPHDRTTAPSTRIVSGTTLEMTLRVTLQSYAWAAPA